MINLKKRQTLKAVGAAVPAVAIPSWALGLPGAEQTDQAVPKPIHVEQDNQHFSIELSFGHDYRANAFSSSDESNEAWITITNHSNTVAIVKHVYPGLIHAGKVSYDINSIFKNSACGIDAGRSRSFKVKPVKATQAETDFPRHLFGKKPLRIAHTTGNDDRGLILQSTRTVYC